MIHEIYSIFDKKEKLHASPFLAPNQDVCVRMVKEQIDKIPFKEDKQLSYLGKVDLVKGVIEADFKTVCDLSDLEVNKNAGVSE